MPTWTIERQYLVPVYQHVTIEAATVEEACQIALGQHPTKPEPDWDSQEYDYDCSRPTHVTRIIAGEHRDAYVEGAKPLAIPEFARGEALSRRALNTITTALSHQAQRDRGLVNAGWVNYLSPDETERLREHFEEERKLRREDAA